MAIKKIVVQPDQDTPISLLAGVIDLNTKTGYAICFLTPDVYVEDYPISSCRVKVDIQEKVVEDFINYITNLAYIKKGIGTLT